MSIVVKQKGGFAYCMDTPMLNRPNTLRGKLLSAQQHVFRYGAIFVGIIVVFLVIYDSLANNWAINDFLGNGYQFITPVADASNVNDLMDQYSFAHGYGISDLAKITKKMTNYTIVNLVMDTNPYIYVLEAGTYSITSEMNLCPIFQKSYPVDITKTRQQLGVVVDAISFLRGEAFSHAFTEDATTNLANSSMGSAQLESLGYKPTRIVADLRLTQSFVLKNTTATQQLVVGYYRIYSKSYCTGCIPIAEFGHGSCNFTMQYNDTEKMLKISLSNYINGSRHDFGLMFQQTAFSAASHYLKFIAILFALGGFLASRRTVQWQDVDLRSTETFVQRVIKTMMPQYYPHMSYAIRFDMFCYNSDIFVLLFTAGVILDIGAAIKFTREVQVFLAACPNGLMSLQLFALSTRLLWVNCALLKIIKYFWSTLSTAGYSGESHIMGFFNFTSVTSLYMSGILLFYIPAFIEYNNSVRQDLKSNVEPLDGTAVNFYESFYVRGSGAIIGGLVLNLLLVVALDQLINRAYWSLMAKNSLARQAMYNSTSILMDFINEIDTEVFKNRNGIIYCKARRLCTLQWFFMSHLTTFGLPEKDLRTKKIHNQATNHTRQNTNQSNAATGISTQQRDSASDIVDKDGNFMVAQDGGHHVHLLDSDIRDVTNLIINIKILKNTSVAIN
ncbi:hypothetical protein THRCLA_06294 [Thraustotheca clavata]|uniref:Uncharacterized protein n=1 Tax=Thraustotheca clavata TaxID=74557 RepID=A0A1V9ZPS4_9STRA|nr:hypothetical protein THRCLA_06294 [Thraustotheca clavata]